MIDPAFVLDAFAGTILGAAIVLALSIALALGVLTMRRPADLPLLAAGALVVVSAIVVIVVPVAVPLPVALALATLGTALATIGGNPVSRRILEIATRGRVVEGDAGGIMILGPRPGQTNGPRDLRRDEGDSDDLAPREVMRGGTVIGYLERLAVALSIIAGFPEAIAVVVAIKSVGRFSELATAETRERFIIGTLASLLWACIVAAVVRLAVW